MYIYFEYAVSLLLYITCTNMVINYEGAMYLDYALYLNCYILRW